MATSASFESTRPHASDRSRSDEEDSSGDHVGVHSPNLEELLPSGSSSERRRESIRSQNKESRRTFLEDFDSDRYRPFEAQKGEIGEYSEVETPERSRRYRPRQNKAPRPAFIEDFDEDTSRPTIPDEGEGQDYDSWRRGASMRRQNKPPRRAFVEDFDDTHSPSEVDKGVLYEYDEHRVEISVENSSLSQHTISEYDSSEPPDRKPSITASTPRRWRPTPLDYPPDYGPDMRRSERHSSESQYRKSSSYVPPVNVEDASSNLSVTVTLRSLNGERWTDLTHPMAQSWMQAKTELAHGSKTEYFAIRAADYYTDDVGDSMVTLVCYDEDTPKNNEFVQMRWLHLQQSDSDLQVFEDLILHSPHVDSSLKSVALALLRDHRRSSGPTLLEGVPQQYITRYDYKDNHGVWNGQSVTFMKVPFFTMKKNFNPVPGQKTYNSTVPIRYHAYRDHGLVDCDFWTSGTRSSVIGAVSGDELCVTYLWCLLLGSGTIITCGDISTSDILASSIMIDKMSNATKRPCAIRIIDPESRCLYLVIELPLPYFEFMKHASNITRLPNDEVAHGNFRLFTEDDDLLTPERWVDLMQREDVDSLQLLLIRDEESLDESDDFGTETRTARTYRSNQSMFERGNDITGKVVNDVQNVIPPRHYIMDSSSESEEFGDKGADIVQQTATKKLFRESSLVVSETGGDAESQTPKFPKTGSHRERAVHFVDDIEVGERKGTTPVESVGSLDSLPPSRTPLIIHPFFTWNAVSYSSSRVNDDQLHVKVYNILSQVDKAMARKRQRMDRYLYRRGFECTLQELERRHPYLTNTQPSVISDQIFDTKRDGLDGVKGGTFHPVLEKDHDFYTIRHPIEWEDMVRVFLRPIFSMSKAVAQTFVQADMEVMQRCWKKLWGSLDRIMRCIEIHYKLSHGSSKYIVNSRLLSSSTVLGNTEEGVLNCIDCDEGTRYSDLQATLDHLHEKHSQCQSCSKPKRLFDDPCTVWVKSTMIGKKSKVFNSLSSQLFRLREFVEYLESIQKCVMELQLSVQYVGNEKTGQDAASTLPFLPSTLVRGFEEFLLSTISLAHYLSRSTFPGLASALKIPSRLPLGLGRNKRPRGQPLYPKADSSAHAGSLASHANASSHDASSSFIGNTHYMHAIATQSSSMARAISCLKQARRDLVLLSTTTSRAGGVNSTSIGPEFLVALMLANLNTHVNGKKMELIQMYNRRLMRIANQATRNPQRRLFLELHGLEDDMDAIKRVVLQQYFMMSNYDRVLDPHSYRVTTKARRTLHEIEHVFIVNEQTRLGVRIWEADAFLKRVLYYRNRIKQHIDMLEEGHGKAIRVFTFITAFFLPLSFCSSFMGMNTTDIRDTKFDQSIFWEIAIPSTITILALAFLYGYKWDDIYASLVEWQEQRGREIGQKRAIKLAEQYGEGVERPRWSGICEKLKLGQRRDIKPEKDWRYVNGAAV